MSLQKIGRYDITGELGKGAMGVVYKATDPNIGRTVAIKTTRLDAHGLDTEDLLRRFRNEARAAGTLNHPNIVTIYDAGEQDGVFYIAMEYLEGETLHGMLSQHRSLPVEKVIDIVRQVCAGLDYAHAHGVIHRDVKPANIMLGASGAVKVMDFGIAKAGGTVTATGQVLGTPNYMSPEQVKGKPIDGRSDLFSVGVLLYEMLTGEKPFDGQNVTTIIYKIVAENPIPPRELDVTIHPGLSAVVTKALAKAPDERYQTGAELVADLANYKSFGSESGATQLVSTAAFPAAGDRTVVTPAPPPVRPPASVTAAAAPAPAPPPATVPVSSAPGMNMRVLAGVVVVLLIAALIAWRVYRRHQQQGQEAAATQSLPAVQQPAAAPPPAPPAETATAPAAPPETPSAEATPAPEPSQPQPALRAASKPKAKTAAASPIPAPQPAPAADATGTGTVHVTSTPLGAAVTIDGSGAYVTPFDSPPLKAGPHAFSVSKLGWSTVQRKLDVVAGKATNLDVSLAVSGAIVELQSDPPGAAILVDEKPTNKFTPARLAIPQGEHKIRLRMEGFKDENTVVTLAEGQTLSLSPKLGPAKGSKLKRLFKGGGGSPENMGTLEVTTHPDGAHITLNDAAAPDTTPAKVAAKPGKYDLAIILPGYKTVHRAVEIEKGKTLGVDEVLEKEQP
jgi:predicted Ser/Thr protein kinase